jgi:hypothetical protein
VNHPASRRSPSPDAPGAGHTDPASGGADRAGSRRRPGRLDRCRTADTEAPGPVGERRGSRSGVMLATWRALPAQAHSRPSFSCMAARLCPGYVRLAQDLARGACSRWPPAGFRAAPGRAPPSPRRLPGVASHAGCVEPRGCADVDALVQAARTLPDARADRIGPLDTHAVGRGAELRPSVRTAGPRAQPGGYPSQLADLPQLMTPVLMLHGRRTARRWAGSPPRTSGWRDSKRHCERTSVEAVLRGGRHNGMFSDETQYAGAADSRPPSGIPRLSPGTRSARDGRRTLARQLG